MPSRKRAKGKERKANAVVRRAEARRSLWTTKVMMDEKDRSIRCNHGHGGSSIIPPKDHPVSTFMDMFATLSLDEEEEVTIYDLMKDLYINHPLVWGNSSYRIKARSLLLSIGMNSIVQDLDREYVTANSFARACLVLESCHGREEDFDSFFHRARGNVFKMNGGNQRDVLKFYSKRISCSCLKQRYKWARSRLPKTGKCDGCGKKCDRSSLLLCG